jgi:acetyl esterase/lipase
LIRSSRWDAPAAGVAGELLARSSGRHRLRLARLATAVVIGLTALAGCSPLASLNDLFVSGSGYRLERGLRYGSERRQMLDVYAPLPGARQSVEPMPVTSVLVASDARVGTRVVVFLYGGAWRGGSRDYYRFVGEALASQGLVVVIPDYRVYPEVQFPVFNADAARAVRWVRDNIAGYGGNPDDIVLLGHSAGAHIAALLVTDQHYLAAAGVPSAAIRGFVGLAGPYGIDPRAYRITRGPFATVGDPAEAQPTAQVTGGEPPMLLLHGDADGTVWPVNSLALAERVNAAGGAARMIGYPDLGHIGILLAFAEMFRDGVPVFADTVRFITGGAAPPPAPRLASGGNSRLATP